MNIKVFNKNDEYYTKNMQSNHYYHSLKPFKKIWCPFDMEWSNYVKMLQKDHEVIYTHKDTGGDFFKIEVPKCDAIVSNPPYRCLTPEHQVLTKKLDGSILSDIKY